MLERGCGAIVVIGSWMAHVGSPIVGFSSVSKAAEIQFARSGAAEFGSRGRLAAFRRSVLRPRLRPAGRWRRQHDPPRVT
ncbi:MAG: hypothetical protein ABI112_09825 [Terracoccus sp.]